MLEKEKIPYYILAIVLFLSLKFGFKYADNNDLAFLLKPTDKIVGFVFDSHSVYQIDSGYFHKSMNIRIDKSCAGFNYWALNFIMLSFLGLKYSGNNLKIIFAIPMALILAYFVSVFVNTSRIIVSIIVQKQTSDIFESQQHTIHESIGIITNLSFLIIVYLIAKKILTKRNNYAKLT